MTMENFGDQLESEWFQSNPTDADGYEGFEDSPAQPLHQLFSSLRHEISVPEGLVRSELVSQMEGEFRAIEDRPEVALKGKRMIIKLMTSKAIIGGAAAVLATGTDSPVIAA